MSRPKEWFRQDSGDMAPDRKLILCPHGLPAAEQLLDIAMGELYPGWPAMVALPGVGRDFHFAKERVHLRDRQYPPGANRSVAGHCRRYMIQPVPKRERGAELGNLGGQVPEQRRDVGLSQWRRSCANQHRRRSEPPDLQAEGK